MTSEDLILLHPADNVLICRNALAENDTVVIEGVSIVLTADIGVGHKVARRDIGLGEKVLKYGAPVGSMSIPVSIGGHVHMHNMKSDYIATHTRRADEKEHG